METDKTTQRVPIRELVKYYLRLGLLGFGGPVALVGQMERELVGEKKWLTKEEMREGVAVCQSLPGPLAIQVGIWISYIRGGFWPAQAPQKPPRMYEIQMPTWMARGPGNDWQTATPSRISSFVSHFFSPTSSRSICPTSATGPPKPRRPSRK